MDINIYIFIIEMEINMFDDNIEERYSLAIERIQRLIKMMSCQIMVLAVMLIILKMYRRLYCLWISSRMI